MNRLIIAIGGVFFLAPVATFLVVAKRSIRIFDSVSDLPAEQRPSVLATSISEASTIHYSGIAGYYLGIVLMVYLLNKGYRKEAGVLWIFAIATVILVCTKEALLLGILTAVVLIWKRKSFRPPATAI